MSCELIALHQHSIDYINIIEFIYRRRLSWPQDTTTVRPVQSSVYTSPLLQIDSTLCIISNVSFLVSSQLPQELLRAMASTGSIYIVFCPHMLWLVISKSHLSSEITGINYRFNNSIKRALWNRFSTSCG